MPEVCGLVGMPPIINLAKWIISPQLLAQLFAATSMLNAHMHLTGLGITIILRDDVVYVVVIITFFMWW